MILIKVSLEDLRDKEVHLGLTAIHLHRRLPSERRGYAPHIGLVLCGSPLGMPTNRLSHPTSPSGSLHRTLASRRVLSRRP